DAVIINPTLPTATAEPANRSCLLVMAAVASSACGDPPVAFSKLCSATASRPSPEANSAAASLSAPSRARVSAIVFLLLHLTYTRPTAPGGEGPVYDM